MQITAFPVQYGDAPVNLGQDCVAYLIRFLTDNLNLRPRCAHEQHFIQHKGINQYQYHSVQDIFRRTEQCL